MKNNFQSKSVPRGTRTIWRYLSALILLFSLAIGNVRGTEVTVGYTTGLGAKNATTTTRSIADVDHVTITHIINSGTSDALSLYAKSDKSLYYGSSTATYSYGGYKWNKSTGTTFNDNYVGFQVDVEDGYKLSLSELELTLAVTAGFTCKVEITDGTNNLYSSDSWAIANNGKNGTNGINPTFTAVGNPDLQDLTGTFYVRVQLAFSSTGKYLCCPIFTVTGELETATPATTHKLTWDFDGGSCSATPGTDYTAGGQVAEGATITYPANNTMSKSGKDFDGWSSSATTMPTSDLKITALWKDHSTSSDATLSALSVTGLTLNETFDPATTAYTANLPFYGVMPTASAVTATKNDSHASDPVVSISGNVISVEVTPESGAEDKKTYTITVNIADAPTASSSINIEQAVLDHGTGYNIGAALTTANISYVDKDALDSLKDQSGRNEPYLGLKFKKSSSKITVVVPAEKVLNIKWGNISTAIKVKINGESQSDITTTSTGTIYHLDAANIVRQVEFSVAADKKTIVLKQVMVGEDIKTVTLPWLVTYDAGEHGTCATAKETWKGTALTLPAVTPESGWNFEGWKDDEDNPVSSPYTPTKNVTLTAQYTAQASPYDLTSLTYKIGTGAATNVGYVDGTFTYNIELPYKPSYDAITVAPTLKVGTSSIKEGAVLTVSSLPGVATFTVVENGGANEKLYTVNFSKAAKDGACLIKVTADTYNTNTVTPTGAGTGWVSLSNGDSEKSTYDTYTGYKMNTNGRGIRATLAEGNFQENDVVEVFVTHIRDGKKLQIFSYDGSDYTLQQTAEEGCVLGANRLTMGALSSVNSLAVYRDGSNGVNPDVAYLAVYRAMNPVLTAITINERAGVIDPLDDKHFNVQIPYEADLANLTIVPTIVRNAPHATTPEAVISNAGAWIEGDNTYRVMDKDGDYTDYTITLDRDVLKHTVSFNTHGGTAVASEEVVHGEYLAAAPAAPTKDENVFKFWSETEDGAEVNVTTVQINADKEFHAVWEAEPAGIKLFNGNVLNTNNFISAAATTIEIGSDEYPCLVAFNSNRTSLAGAKQGDLVLYNATTDAAKIKFDLYNANESAKKAYVWLVEEGDAAATQLDEIEIAGETRVKTAYYEFNGTKNRTVYLTSGAKADIKVLQAKVIESGSAIKQFGQAGYSLNLNKGRLATVENVAVPFEGATLTVSSEYSVLNSSNLATKSANSFNVASPVIMHVERSGGKYYVYQDPADKGTLYTANADIELNTTGTWYISSETSSSAASFTKIEFLAPRCEQPTITPMSNSDLCEGNAFEALTVTASVSDGGTLHYAWFKEAGADDEAVGTDAASFTPEADGEYYVIVTNRKDGFSDNSATSNTVTVTHYGAPVITSAPLNQRGEVDDVVTLTVAATGKNVSYKWYTCDEDGSNEVALDPAETGTSLNVTVTAGMNQWYKVIVTSDCGNAEAKAKVSEFEPTTPANVTNSILWDWTSSVWPASGTAAFTNEDAPDYELLADADAIVPNAEGFRSDMLYGKGQYVWRSDNKFFQGSAIKFTSTVAGMVRVYFRSTKEGRTVNVAINGTDAGSRTNSFGWSSYVEVPAGEVEILCTGNGYTRIQKIEFLEIIDSRTEYAAKDLGTACYEYDALVIGATAYMIAGINESGYIVFDEIGELEAGKPYLFEADGGKIFFCKPIGVTAAPLANGEEITVKGMVGTFTGTTLTQGADDLCYFSGRHLWRVNDFGVDIEVEHNRCYVNYDVLKAAGPASAPAAGRRRVTMGINGKDATQGFENILGGETPMKVMIDGTLYIIRGEKVFDATGRLVK